MKNTVTNEGYGHILNNVTSKELTCEDADWIECREHFVSVRTGEFFL